MPRSKICRQLRSGEDTDDGVVQIPHTFSPVYLNAMEAAIVFPPLERSVVKRWFNLWIAHMPAHSRPHSSRSSLMLPFDCRFKGGVDALNRVAPSDRFPLLLSRVISSLPSSGGYAFSAKEEAQLADVLSLDAEGVRLVLETSAYVFERAALHALKAPQLLAMLAESGLEEAHVSGRGEGQDPLRLSTRLRLQTANPPSFSFCSAPRSLRCGAANRQLS